MYIRRVRDPKRLTTFWAATDAKASTMLSAVNVNPNEAIIQSLTRSTKIAR